MFGKYFASTFTGSMVGAGLNVFAVWGYIVANTRADGLVELNPPIIAAMIGCPVTEIETAIEFLTSPDPRSRSKKHDGRRLVQEAPFLYFVPNYSDYRAIRDDDDRREYMKNYMREYRAAKADVNVNVNNSKPSLAHAEAEAEEEADKEEEREQPKKETATPPARTAIARARDERVDHPAIQAIRLVTNRFPDKGVWNKLIEELGVPDLQRLSACYAEWVAVGFKPTNLAWAFEWYKNGIPEKQNGTNKQNQNGKATSVDRIVATAKHISQYPTEAELRSQS